MSILEWTSCIAPEHPCLAGHFPGQPLVPGVVLLEQIVRRASEWVGEERWLRALPVVKFTAPLAPGETFQVRLEQGADGALRFRVARGETLIASGSMALAEPRRP